ncbi:MAG: Methyltransferase type 11 [Parcubacteria group bacterium GW2011_GWC2_39_14]|nr:MAG: Methyltransferase type 11 [Parcubacteria group bacterium GW2011_GWC2_39_14]
MEPQAYKQLVELQRNRHWWFVGRSSLIRSLLSHHLKKSNEQTLLDIGCGMGGNAELLQNFGETTGLDPQKQAVETCSKKYDHVILGTVYNIPKEKKFNAITLLDVLEHITDDQETLNTIYEQTKPGGIVLITVPAFPFLWSNHDVLLHHKRRYTKTELKQKTKQAGFEILTISHFMFTTFPFFLIFRLCGRVWRKLAKIQTYFDPIFLLPRPLNSFLIKIINLEGKIIKHKPLPFGSSLVCCAQKPKK